MVYRKKKFFPKKKKTYRKKKFLRASRQVGLLGANPVMTLKYAEQLTLNPVIYSYYDWTVNSLFDPNNTGVGHQPMGYDNIMAMYAHYCVLKVQAKVTFLNLSTSVPAQVGFSYLRNGASGLTSINQFAENTNGKVYTLGVQGSGQERVTHYSTVLPARFLGIHKPYTDDRLWGNVSGGPNELLHGSVFVQSADASSNPNVFIYVQFRMFSVFREPITQSLN